VRRLRDLKERASTLGVGDYVSSSQSKLAGALGQLERSPSQEAITKKLLAEAAVRRMIGSELRLFFGGKGLWTASGEVGEAIREAVQNLWEAHARVPGGDQTIAPTTRAEAVLEQADADALADLAIEGAKAAERKIRQRVARELFEVFRQTGTDTDHGQLEVLRHAVGQLQQGKKATGAI